MLAALGCGALGTMPSTAAAEAFADEAAGAPVTESAETPVAVKGTAAGAAAPIELVEIDGRSWRRSPPGTVAAGGRAGSRILLDGEIWLAADDPRFAELDVAAGPDPVVAAATAGSGRDEDAAPARPEPAAALPAATHLAARTVPVKRVPANDAPSQDAPERRARAGGAPARSRQEASAALAVVARGEPPVLAAAVPPPAAPDEENGPAPIVAAGRETDPAVAEAAGAVTATAPGESTAAEAAPPLAALRLPRDARGSSAEYGYVEAMPMTYAIGGAGIGLEASGQAAERFHFYGRIGAAESYREVAVGAGVHVTPPDADRLSFALTGGVEYGAFELVGTDGEGGAEIRADDAEAGLFVTLSSRLVVSPRFELAGGVGYSSFHDGDPHGFGGAFFHLDHRFDLMSRFEVGDNDQLGIGLRLYY